MLDGYKNYIYGAVFVLAGIASYFLPDLGIQIGGIDSPQEFVAIGVAWILGRNVLKKLES